MSNLLYNIKLTIALILYRVQVGLVRAFPSILDSAVRLERLKLKKRLKAEKREKRLELREKKKLWRVELKERRRIRALELRDIHNKRRAKFRAYVISKWEIIKCSVINLINALDAWLVSVDSLLEQAIARFIQYIDDIICNIEPFLLKLKSALEVNKRMLAVLVPVLIISVIVLNSMHNSYLYYSKSLKVQQDLAALADYEAEVWRQAYEDAEIQRVGIVFDAPELTDMDYESLRVACMDYVNSLDSNFVDTGSIISNIVVSERQYIDGMDLNIINNDNNIDLNGSVDLFAESNIIYFQDALFIQYVGQNGVIRDVIAMYNSDKSNILFLNKEDVLGAGFGNRLANRLGDSEGLYLDGLKESVIEMLMVRSLNEMHKAEGLIVDYFTNDSNHTIFGAVTDGSLSLSEDSQVELVTCIAGRSSLSKGYKDRVYMQLRMYVDNVYHDTYIILKLNSNLKVFDVDII